MSHSVEVQPPSFSNVVAVTGGHLRRGSPPWIAEKKEYGDVVYIHCCKANPSFKRFVGGNWDMVDALIRIRNDRCDQAMRDTSVDDDPLQDTAQVPMMPKRKRRDMFDDIANHLLVSVKCDDNSIAHVQVLADWRKQGTLWIECSVMCLEVLLKKPLDEYRVFVPVISQPNVRWWAARHSVYCRYYDAHEKRNRLHSLPVRRSEDNSEVQQRAEEAAELLQRFCDEAQRKAAESDSC